MGEGDDAYERHAIADRVVAGCSTEELPEGRSRDWRGTGGAFMSFKASIHDIVELLVAVSSDFSDDTIPKGIRGTVVERYDQPKEGYSVDLAIPDESLSGGFRYENVLLMPEQFIVRQHIEPIDRME